MRTWGEWRRESLRNCLFHARYPARSTSGNHVLHPYGNEAPWQEYGPVFKLRLGVPGEVFFCVFPTTLK